MDAYNNIPLLRVSLRLNTFCREKCVGRKAHWISPLGLWVPHENDYLSLQPM